MQHFGLQITIFLTLAPKLI